MWELVLLEKEPRNQNRPICYFADINFSYLIDAINQDVTLEAHVEGRSAEILYGVWFSVTQNLHIFEWGMHCPLLLAPYQTMTT